MLYEIMRYCRNFFVVPNGVHTSKWEISNGEISLPFLADNQLYIIEGSVFNDGACHRKGDTDLIDEEFEGSIIAIAPPKAFLELVSEIEAWQKDYKPSDFQSESFGGYSYTKTSGTSQGWQNAFSNRLKIWRKM